MLGGMRCSRDGAPALLLLLLLPGMLLPAASARADERSLRFERDGRLLRTLALSELRRACEPRVVEVPRDPYYGRAKSFLACPLGAVLAAGFGAAPDAGSDEDYFFRARDGYVKPASGARLAEPGGFLALADAGRGGDAGTPAWEPIDRRQLDPGPFYVVWTRPGQDDPHRYPWPYQLEAVEIASFAARYPHTAPESAERGTIAWEGFAVFRRECIACHAVNGEGGSVGPELNVPRSIVEYRPAAQIKAYVRDPGSFRYTSMPAHLHLSDAELDALVAYFETMSRSKFDPRAGAAGGRREKNAK
jgi:mono/diheme cytochrome c family protein